MMDASVCCICDFGFEPTGYSTKEKIRCCKQLVKWIPGRHS